jgi:hypothetical protein
MPLPLVPLAAVAVAVVGGAVVARRIRKEWQRINAELQAAVRAAEPTDRERLPKLKQDPKTGIYSADQQ